MIYNKKQGKFLEKVIEDWREQEVIDSETQERLEEVSLYALSIFRD